MAQDRNKELSRMSTRSIDRVFAVVIGAVLVAVLLLLAPELKGCFMSQSHVTLRKLVATPEGREREIVVLASVDDRAMALAEAEIERRIAKARAQGYTN